MQITYKSLVKATHPAESEDAQAFFSSKLRYETDCADVHHDISHDIVDFVLVDVRSPEDYARSHVPQAINIPQSRINERKMQDFDPDTLFIVYCWGPGCNGATKAAVKLSKMGFAVKEMIGGIEYWEDRERYPIERG